MSFIGIAKILALVGGVIGIIMSVLNIIRILISYLSWSYYPIYYYYPFIFSPMWLLYYVTGLVISIIILCLLPIAERRYIGVGATWITLSVICYSIGGLPIAMFLVLNAGILAIVEHSDRSGRPSLPGRRVQLWELPRSPIPDPISEPGHRTSWKPERLSPTGEEPSSHLGQLTCSSCGGPMEHDDRFCVNCGSPQRR